MVINSLNGNVINSNQVCIHDDILEELSFNRLEKKIHLSLLTEDRSERFSIDFLNVIGFEMTSCDFWGFSPYILDFEYIEEYNDNTIIQKLFNKKDNNHYPFCSLNDREKYIETIITFTSGDQLIIACESIII